MSIPRPIETLTIAVTGASGAPYAEHFLRAVLALGIHAQLVISPAGQRVIREELDNKTWQALLQHPRLRQYPHADIGASMASGSRVADAMVVIPASMGTVARIRAGLASNLIERAADVILKEGRLLILVPRETPFNVIHLENMLGLARAGAVILSANPAYYHRPKTLEDLFSYITGRILDRLGVANTVAPRWKSAAQNTHKIPKPVRRKRIRA